MFSFTYTEATANNAYLLALVSPLLSLGTTEAQQKYSGLMSVIPDFCLLKNVLFCYSLMPK